MACRHPSHQRVTTSSGLLCALEESLLGGKAPVTETWAPFFGFSEPLHPRDQQSAPFMWFACLDLYKGEASQVGEGAQNLQWRRGAEFAVEQAGDQVSALPFTSCVTQSHQLSHTEPSFPHLKPQG